MHIIKYLFIYFILCFYNLSAVQHDFNPYEILGLSRTASDKEIRQAYKKLAKHWHPDKNSEPNAHDQFTKINAAYEILSDPIKRQNYDEYGTTTSQDHHHGFNSHHFRDPFEMFRAHFFQETSSDAKKIIHSHEFLQNILPNSNKKPYLIFGSTNFCFHCRQSLAIFRTMEKQLNDVGIGTGEFNINDERLSHELGVFNIPSLCMISQGRVYHFNDQDFTETNIKEFIRKSLPIKRYIKNLETYDDILTMINSYKQSNRVHAILITKQKNPTLKFIIPCLQYSTRIQCALFNSSTIKSSPLPSFLQSISLMSDTILLFKEDINQADIVIKDNDFHLNNIQNLFELNQLLYLPTITSANVFNLVCQINSAKPGFLIIGNSKLFSQYYSSLIQLAKNFFQESKSHMAYLDLSSTKQVEFNQILSNYYDNNTDKKLLILAIRQWSDDKIEIYNTNIEFDEKSLNNLESNQISIKENLKLFLNIHWQNAKKYSLPQINNNEKISFDFENIFDQFQNQWNYWIERNRLLRYFSGYLYTYQFWMITIFIFIYMYYSRQELEKTKKSNKINQMKIYKFNESLLQYYTNPNASNVIIFVLIADTRKDSCVKKFTQEINSIKKDSRMVFSILYRENSSKWLDELLNKIEDQQSIEFSSSTILALYIRRKFFVIYHTESSTLTFSDWIDLLYDGTFRERINITEWPMKFF